MKIQPDSKLGNLIIIRGIAGSGKSTLARTLLDKIEAEHFEADMYFMEDGEYKFVQNDLHKAHYWCQRQTRNSLLDGKNVIVSNTFIKLRDMKVYLDMECASLAIYEAKGDYGSIHDVPEFVINRMKDQWQELPKIYNEYKDEL